MNSRAHNSHPPHAGGCTDGLRILALSTVRSRHHEDGSHALTEVTKEGHAERPRRSAQHPQRGYIPKPRVAKRTWVAKFNLFQPQRGLHHQHETPVPARTAIRAT